MSFTEDLKSILGLDNSEIVEEEQGKVIRWVDEQGYIEVEDMEDGILIAARNFVHLTSRRVVDPDVALQIGSKLIKLALKKKYGVEI